MTAPEHIFADALATAKGALHGSGEISLGTAAQTIRGLARHCPYSGVKAEAAALVGQEFEIEPGVSLALITRPG